MAVNEYFILRRIKEANDFQKLIHNNIKVGDAFRVNYKVTGIDVSHIYTVEKLYPSYVLVSYEASGKKLYGGWAYEDIYYMKNSGEMPQGYIEQDEMLLEA